MLASQEVEVLAHDLLTKEEYERANEIAIMLVSSKPQKRKAVFELMKLVAPPPKRPLYYAQHELQFLPRWTRDAIRDMGDYIDILAKHLAFRCTNQMRVSSFPLGASLQAVEKSGLVSNSLIQFLKRYNSSLYRPGKHEFKLPSDRKGHRFTSKEVVYTAFIIMKLATAIKEITHCDTNFTCHFPESLQDKIESNQGS